MSSEPDDEGATDPSAPVVIGDVNGMLNRESVTRPTSRISEVAIGGDSHYVVAVGGNKHWMVSGLFLAEPGQSLIDGIQDLSPLEGG